MAPLPHCRELVDDQRIPELLTADAPMETEEKLKQVHHDRFHDGTNSNRDIVCRLITDFF
jgi:hypothetical protein